MCWYPGPGTLFGFIVAFGYNINIMPPSRQSPSVSESTSRFTKPCPSAKSLTSGVSRIDAVRLAAEGTGTALMLSGGTSIVGFGLLALVPMPIFAAYGLLTAVMVGLSLLAALTVLPSLLYIVSSEPVTEPVSEATSESVPALA